MKRVYPVIFTKCDTEYLVYIPDFDISTQGENIADAIDMARDAINLMGITKEDLNQPIPEPSYIEKIDLEKGQFSTLVDCDFDEYRIALDNRAVRKNCTLPSWLNKKAEKAHINFSAVLQEALIERLGSEH